MCPLVLCGTGETDPPGARGAPGGRWALVCSPGSCPPTPEAGVKGVEHLREHWNLITSGRAEDKARFYESNPKARLEWAMNVWRSSFGNSYRIADAAGGKSGDDEVDGHARAILAGIAAAPTQRVGYRVSHWLPSVGEIVNFTLIGATKTMADASAFESVSNFAGAGEGRGVYFEMTGFPAVVFPDGREFITSGSFRVVSVEPFTPPWEGRPGFDRDLNGKRMLCHLEYVGKARKVAKSNTLYRGMELRGINEDDEMIEAMRSGAFETFVVRLVRNVVAKADVSQWSMRMGDPGKGVGVHWSTDLSIAKSFSYSNSADRFTTAMFDSWLSIVVEATYTPGDEVANPEQNSHAYGWEGRDEKEIPLRPGAPLTMTRVHVRVPSNMAKFVADYDEKGEASTASVKWLTIPLGFSAVAGIVPATTLTSGPFRTVVDVEKLSTGYYGEVLECGHPGKVGWKAEELGTNYAGKPMKRRCYNCLSLEHRLAINGNPNYSHHVCSEACVLPVGKTSSVTKVADAFDDISLDAGDMRFYEWEGKQQKAVGGGRKINSVGEARALAAKVLPDYGIDPAKVSIRMEGWDSYSKLDGDRVEIKIGYGYSGDGATTAWNVLHELAHAILFLRGNTRHRHGPDFERMLLELIGKYTRVRGVTPHQSSVTASVQLATRDGFTVHTDANLYGPHQRWWAEGWLAGRIVDVAELVVRPGRIGEYHVETISTDSSFRRKGLMTWLFDTALDWYGDVVFIHDGEYMSDDAKKLFDVLHAKRPDVHHWSPKSIYRSSSVATWREKVDALPESYIPAIMSAVENVYNQGYSEGDDEFWERVYGEVMA